MASADAILTDTPTPTEVELFMVCNADTLYTRTPLVSGGSSFDMLVSGETVGVLVSRAAMLA